MIKRYLLATLLSMSAIPAHAKTGYYLPIEPSSSVAGKETFKVMKPQPGWHKVLGIIASDGTTKTPSCSQTNVIDTVKKGILSYWNNRYNSVTAGNYQMFDDVDMGAIWVHPTFSGGFVCDVNVRLMSKTKGLGTMLAPESYKFETFAQDGKAYVFYVDVGTEN